MPGLHITRQSFGHRVHGWHLLARSVGHLELCTLVYDCAVKSADLVKLVKADGWFLVHVVGSHHQFKHPIKPGKVTVPHPKKDLPLPTVRSILKQAGL